MLFVRRSSVNSRRVAFQVWFHLLCHKQNMTLFAFLQTMKRVRKLVQFKQVVLTLGKNVAYWLYFLVAYDHLPLFKIVTPFIGCQPCNEIDFYSSLPLIGVLQCSWSRSADIIFSSAHRRFGHCSTFCTHTVRHGFCSPENLGAVQPWPLTPVSRHKFWHFSLVFLVIMNRGIHIVGTGGYCSSYFGSVFLEKFSMAQKKEQIQKKASEWEY